MMSRQDGMPDQSAARTAVVERPAPDPMAVLLDQVHALANIGTWVAELDGSGRCTWSAETHRIFGVAPGRFDGTSEACGQFIHQDDLAAVRAAGAAAISGRTRCEIEHRIIRGDGAVRWVRSQADVVGDEDGRPLRMVGIVQDITERRLFEDEIRQSQKTQTIGRLAGGIAHDLNNALTAISGYAELALSAVGPEHIARADIDEIRKGAERAGAVMRQLLAFSRRELLEPRVFDLNATVSGIARMLGHLIGSGVQLRIALADDPPPIYGDPGQVEQAIVNLAVNARDAMKEQGTLSLETTVADVTEEFAKTHHAPMAPGRYVVLRATDTGHGMSKETQGRIFEPFFTTKEAGKGTGLGLSMVFGTVKQSGGFIFVDSEPGRGTTFSLYFPPAPRRTEAPGPVPAEAPARLAAGVPETAPVSATAAETRAAAPANEPIGEAGTGRTVLVVEDEQAIRNLVMSSLRNEGYGLLVADSGEQALRVAAAHPGTIDLLLTDAMMPGQSGLDLARELAAARPGLRVMVMSGYTGDMLGLNAAGGSAAMLNKPFTPRELRQRIHEALSAGQPFI